MGDRTPGPRQHHLAALVGPTVAWRAEGDGPSPRAHHRRVYRFESGGMDPHFAAGDRLERSAVG